ncbi:MAG: DUF1854 domain-containing protein [Defluviitaleaceae bacterium]|nr:DUF1854 domain-containing protein [Defluviitaleaceae bacterium]MCL2238422.1 DUF1854 domain-containing protein [Defluviitaleaceae bacterium]
MEIIDTQLDLGILDVKDLRFYIADGGFLGLKHKDEDYRHIVLRRIMPMEYPMEYISVADHENKEIGILRDVAALPAEQCAMVEHELDNRYYSPQIIEVLSVRDKLGYVYMEMKLKNKQGRIYDKSCAIKDVNRNIRTLPNNSAVIFDVDGNRFIVPLISDLSKQSQKKLDAYLY